MPLIFDDDVPTARLADGGKTSKVFRNKLGWTKPSVISKHIEAADSDYAAPKFIGQNGRLRKFNSREAFPSVSRTDPLGLESFEVLYSIKKKARWNIAERMALEIEDFQDASSGVRVSMVRCPVDSSYRYHSMELNLFNSNLDVVSEYHTVDSDMHAVHKHMKRTPLETLKKKPNPPKRGRKKNKAGEFAHPFVESPMPSVEEQCKQPYWTRKAHIVYKEHYMQINKQRVNSSRRMTVLKLSRHNGGKEKKFSEKYNKASLMDEEICPMESSIVPKEGTSTWDRSSEEIRCDDRFVFLDGPSSSEESCTSTADSFVVVNEGQDTVSESESFDETTSSVSIERVELDGPLLEAPFEEFLVFPLRRIKTKRKRARELDEEYVGWLKNGELTKDKENRLMAEIGEKAADASLPEVSPLVSFAFSLGEHPDVESFVAREVPTARLLMDVHPRTFIVDVTDDLSFSPLPSVIPPNFHGIAILQKSNCNDGANVARCILNGGELKASSSTERRICAHQLTPSAYLPTELLAHTEVYNQTESESLCATKLLSETTTSMRRVSCENFDTDTQFCGICYTEDDRCISLKCGHFYCTHCWIHHAKMSLKGGFVPIKCPGYSCDELLSVDASMVFLRLEDCGAYRRALWNKCRREGGWLQCDRCAASVRVVQKADSPRRPIVALCSCGFAFCLLCRRAAHVPLSCEGASQYTAFLNSTFGKEYKERRSVLAKQCPSCKELCQRSEGCNHMVCLCGQSFCYNCTEKWTPKHYQCHRKVNVKVYLYSVMKSGPELGVSLKVLRKCCEFRDMFVLPRDSPLRRRHLHKRCGITPEMICHATDVIRVVCELLEYGLIHSYKLHQMYCRRRKAGIPSEGLAMRLSTFRFQYTRLRTLFDRIKTLAEYSGPSSFKFVAVLSDLEVVIRSLISLCS